MGIDLKYGKIITQFGDIPAKEPVFLFRGQDVNIVPVLKFYKQLVMDMGGNPDVIAEIELSIRLMEGFDKKKLAD